MGPGFGAKDIIGVGVTNKGNVFFVQNDELLLKIETGYQKDVYGVVSLRGELTSIEVNLKASLQNILRFKDP